MLDVIQGVLADAWQFMVAGYVFVIHFGASLLSTITKSFSAGGSAVANFFRRILDFLALNIGYARNEDADGETKAELEARYREDFRELHERINGYQRETALYIGEQKRLKEKIAIAEIKLKDKEAELGRLNLQLDSALAAKEKLEKQLKDSTAVPIKKEPGEAVRLRLARKRRSRREKSGDKGD